jgi:hypothetical protein
VRACDDLERARYYPFESEGDEDQFTKALPRIPKLRVARAFPRGTDAAATTLISCARQFATNLVRSPRFESLLDSPNLSFSL